MGKKGRIHSAFAALLIPLLFVGALAYYTQAHNRLERLNRKLVDAILCGDRVSATTALQMGADPNVRYSTHPKTKGLIDVFKAILTRSDDSADDAGKPMLVIVAKGNKTEAASILLDHGADPSLPDPDGMTPLMWAARNGSSVLVRQLLEHGAAVDASNGWGQTALMLGSMNIDQMTSYGVVEPLLSHGANPNAADRDGDTALFYAVKYGSPITVSLLIDKGIDVNMRNREGDTAVDLCWSGDLIRLLKQHGAKE